MGIFPFSGSETYHSESAPDQKRKLYVRKAVPYLRMRGYNNDRLSEGAESRENTSTNRKTWIKVWRYSAELWAISCNGLISPWASSCSKIPSAIRAVIPRNRIVNVCRTRDRGCS